MKRFIPFIVLFAAAAFSADKPYRLLKPIPVGGEGGWDYISIDNAARRLYVAHSTFIEAVDLAKGTVAGRVEGLNGAHGFAVAPELGLGFASSGRDSKAAIVDLKTLKVLSWVATGENPDAILYVSTMKEVYTFNGRGKSATVFEAKSGKITATIALPGKPEFAVFDPKAGMIYNNIEDKSVVVAIDAKTHAVVSTWPIAPGEEASGLAIDLKTHHLFIVCDNKLMVLMDAATGKVLSTAPIGAGVDAAAFDPETGLAFSSNGEGNVTVVRENPAGTLTVVQTLATARSARTMILDPATHRIYLPAAEFEPQPAPKPDEPRQRPKVVSGTFRILVAGAE